MTEGAGAWDAGIEQVIDSMTEMPEELEEAFLCKQPWILEALRCKGLCADSQRA